MKGQLHRGHLQRAAPSETGFLYCYISELLTGFVMLENCDSFNILMFLCFSHFQKYFIQSKYFSVFYPYIVLAHWPYNKFIRDPKFARDVFSEGQLHNRWKKTQTTSNVAIVLTADEGISSNCCIPHFPCHPWLQVSLTHRYQTVAVMLFSH